MTLSDLDPQEVHAHLDRIGSVSEAKVRELCPTNVHIQYSKNQKICDDLMNKVHLNILTTFKMEQE